MLDLVFTNSDDLVENVTITGNLEGSDHEAVEFYLNARKPKVITKKRMIYNYKKADFDALREKLDKVPWECVLELMERSIEINWTNWKDVFDMAVEECVPKVVWKPHKAKKLVI